MKITFFIILIFITSLSYSLVNENIYYIAPDNMGNNLSDGTKAHPWATLKYAVTQVSYGDTLFFMPGTHTINSTVNIKEGLSLKGAGNSSIIYIPIISPDYSWGLVLDSNKTNTNGDQSISFLHFIGPGDQGQNDEFINGAIKIDGRGNVHIHNCSFEDFDDNAVTFSGQPFDGDHEPDIWAMGNSFYKNRVINCSKRQPSIYMTGALQIGSQEGMRIYDNYFQENQRGGSFCGYIIKYYANGYNRDLKIYNNKLIKLPSINFYYDWNFAIELWNYRGAVEICNNEIEGSIDIDHATKGKYDYSIKIHDNQFGYNILPTSSGAWANLNAGIYIEYTSEDIEIYNNIFKNLESIFRFSPRDGDVMREINIHHNVIFNIGNDKEDEGCNVLNFAYEGNFTLQNFKFINNTIYTDVGNAGYCLIFPNQKMENIYIQNNIIQGFLINPIEFNGENSSGLYISNNNFYGNGSNKPNIIGFPNNFILENNTSNNPLFINPPYNLSIQPESDCIDIGAYYYK